MVKSVVVVGAGASGIAAGRRLKEGGYEFEIFEQSDSIGGTWVYDDRTGKNEHGLPIHTSMYKNLRTNLPKEIMGYPDFPIEDTESRSYVPAEVILQFLRDYANHYEVVPHIKFQTLVEKIERIKDGGWRVCCQNLKSKETMKKTYDAVMVCNGHYHTPNIPVFPGVESFKGKAVHSHDYRNPDSFQGLTVVVVGAGPSGLDIARDITCTAYEVYLSHHLPDEISTPFPSNFHFKPDILNIQDEVILFKDGSQVKADVLLYCTGYTYKFPFLHDSCGVTVTNNYVAPLYKHVICINNPTLCFIGLPFYVCANSMFDLQVRFFIATLDGTFKIPTTEAMKEDEKKEMEKRRSLGFKLRDSHKMGPLQGEYYEDLSTTAGITGLPSYMVKLHNESSRRFHEDLINFRNDRYKIVSNDEFVEI